MPSEKALVKSITFTVGSLLIFQGLFFLALKRIFGIHSAPTRAYLLILLGVHAALLTFLLVMRQHFYILPSRRKLERVNVANVLTITRISSTPTILYLLILSGEYNLVPVMLVFTSLVFLTDLLDGKISRNTGQLTKIGQYLDSVSDYAILFAVSIAFIHYQLISQWFFSLVVFRLLFQWAGMGILLLYQGHVETRSTPWGKASVFATMVIYAASILELFSTIRESANDANHYLEYAGAVIIVISVGEKAIWLFHAFRRARENKGVSHG